MCPPTLHKKKLLNRRVHFLEFWYARDAIVDDLDAIILLRKVFELKCTGKSLVGLPRGIWFCQLIEDVDWVGGSWQDLLKGKIKVFFVHNHIKFLNVNKNKNSSLTRRINDADHNVKVVDSIKSCL